MKIKPLYNVIVGNIGRVYSGNGTEAMRVFATYKALSLDNYGRAAGESITIFKDGEIVKEFVGSINKINE